MRVTAVCITDVLVQLPASPGLCWCLLRPVQAAPRGTGSRRFNTSCRSSPAQRASLLSVQTVCHLSHRRLENLVKALDPPRECPSVSGLPAAEWEVPGCPAAHPPCPPLGLGKALGNWYCWHPLVQGRLCYGLLGRRRAQSP